MRNLSATLERQAPSRSIGWRKAATAARREWLSFRRENGKRSATQLLTHPNAQPKAGKNEIPTYVLHLAPSTLAGVNTCGYATAGCAAACLNTSGRGRFDTVQTGRILKTQFLAREPEHFLAILEAEIRAAVHRHGGRALFRLNGTSDLRWERIAPWLFKLDGAEFYDYTKWPQRPGVPSGYALCYSASERDEDGDLLHKVRLFGHVAVVVDTPARSKGELPTSYLGEAAHDGDETDDWRTRPGFTLLRAKGDALTDTSGFVRPTWKGCGA